MQNLTQQLATMRAVQEQCGFDHYALRRLAAAGLKLDADLLSRIDAVIEGTHAKILSRIEKGLYPWPLRGEMHDLFEEHGLPIAVYHLEKREHELGKTINFYRDRPALRLPKDRSRVDPRKITLAEFDARMAAATTLHDRAALLQDCGALFPDIQEEVDIEIRNLIVLRDFIPRIADAVLAHATALVLAGNFPVFDKDDLPHESGLHAACVILEGMSENGGLETVLREASTQLIIQHNVAISLRPDGRSIFVAPCAHDPEPGRFSQAYAKVKRAESLHRKPRLEALTATDVIKAQSPAVRDLFQDAEERLLGRVAAGEIPIVEITSSLSSTDDGEPYVATDNPDTHAPMLMDIFERYMRLKHGIRAVLSQKDDESALVASIDF